MIFQIFQAHFRESSYRVFLNQSDMILRIILRGFLSSSSRIFTKSPVRISFITLSHFLRVSTLSLFHLPRMIFQILRAHFRESSCRDFFNQSDMILRIIPRGFFSSSSRDFKKSPRKISFISHSLFLKVSPLSFFHCRRVIFQILLHCFLSLFRRGLTPRFRFFFGIGGACFCVGRVVFSGKRRRVFARRVAGFLWQIKGGCDRIGRHGAGLKRAVCVIFSVARGLFCMGKDFRAFLRGRVERGLPVFFDGGMGTMIQSSGCADYDIPEDLSITHPKIIKDIYRQYIEAGAQVITANTFGALPLKLASARFSCEQYIDAGIRLALEAVSEAESEGENQACLSENSSFCGQSSAGDFSLKERFVAWDTSQIGQLLEPMGPLLFDEAYETYKTAALQAEKSGADLAIIETMSDLRELKAAILAVKENTGLAIVASCTFQPNLRTLTGADVETVVTYVESLGVDAVGMNCGGSLKEDETLISLFMKYAHLPVLCQPNAGLPVVRGGKTIYLVSPEDFARSQKRNRMAGVTLLGGCCGTTPAHIFALIKAVTEAGQIFPVPPKEEDSTLVCSCNKTVRIGGFEGPKIVGERINPTGKKKVKEALKSGDMNFILSEAESQINSGAHILDVNTGLPGIDEAQMMVCAIKSIQSVFSVPLQIDSSEPAVIEKALRYYNGKALINSVNGRRDVMDKIFPIVKHYGGAVVALCIDEEGIAPDAEGRVRVAEKIIEEAARYSIKPRDILIDTLTLTVSSQQKEASQTCRAISLLKNKYGSKGLKFILGVSNISFGLPRRDIINSRFFMAALCAGLDACIINPLSCAMTETYNAFRAIYAYDENCLSFIEKYTNTSAPLYGVTAQYLEELKRSQTSNAQISGNSNQAKVGATQAQDFSHPASDFSQNKPEDAHFPEDLSAEEKALIDIIRKGFKENSAQAAKTLLSQGKSSVDIIDRCIVPALDAVGKDFERGTKFLPQLLLSADTVSSAFAIIKEHLQNTGERQESKGTIVIATVFGDIHDIGKNIVKAMLENYSYTVIDLGKNVPAELIVKTVLDNNIKLLGLSALMTTTVGSMEKTISLLRSELAKTKKTCTIMAGGAVLTADYALQIGADYYAKDAMASVAIAKKVFGK